VGGRPARRIFLRADRIDKPGDPSPHAEQARSPTARGSQTGATSREPGARARSARARREESTRALVVRIRFRLRCARVCNSVLVADHFGAARSRAVCPCVEARFSGAGDGAGFSCRPGDAFDSRTGDPRCEGAAGFASHREDAFHDGYEKTFRRLIADRLHAARGSCVHRSPGGRRHSTRRLGSQRRVTCGPC
jgi:hypothetical protein